MFNFDKSEIQRFTVSAVGALALSAASIFGAVAPVKAATPQALTVAEWRGKVERQIDNGSDSSLASVSDQKVRFVSLALDFTADGDFALASITQSSGNKVIDASALGMARRVRYPALPNDMRGAPQTIAMKLYYGRTYDAVEQAHRGSQPRVRQFAAGKGIQLAAR